MFIFVANSSLNPMIAFAEDRPIPNVITGGNPRKKDVPWPTKHTNPPKRKYYSGDTFYKRANSRMKYYNYVRTYDACAPRRSTYYVFMK